VAKSRQLKAQLEREAKEASEQESQRKEERKARKAKGEEVVKTYHKPMWSKSASGEIEPKAKTQRNLTDPDSRVMMNTMTRSFEQAYNAQIAVDAQAQIIVAASVVQATNDAQQLLPALTGVKQNLGRLPAVASADAGYFSPASLADEKLQEVDLYVPPNNQPGMKSRPTVNATIREKMRAKLQRPGGYDI